MADDSKSENEKKEEETSKPQSRKGKGRKSPDRIIEDIMKKANFARDVERQLWGKHDLRRIMEQSDWVQRSRHEQP